jgi:hypothetical protein
MPTTAIPFQYQSDYLFLLMGTNPLPNYVAATTLLKEGGTVIPISFSEKLKTPGA